MKFICCDCIGENFLREEVCNSGIVRKCSYCKSRGITYTIMEISERIEVAFEQHYKRTADQPDAFDVFRLSDRESDFIWWREGEKTADAIQYAADIPQSAASDIQILLAEKYHDRHADEIGEETEFDAGAHYERKDADDLEWQAAWREFEHSLKTQARFFSKTASDRLAKVFGGIDAMETHDGRKLVVNAGPKTRNKRFYRARVFQSDHLLKEALKRPDQHIGTPPSSSASSGRMNARGISVFYGANRPDVAIAEVRPPVGSRVVVACFHIVRPIRLLDLTALGEVMTEGSVFDPTAIGRFERVKFLRSLSSRITRPVMPDDEPFEYLATQAIADFLATENEPRVDGILFPSVQAGGKALNVVLFHKASEVADIELPKCTDLSVQLERETDDGCEDDYVVFEELIPEEFPTNPLDKSAPFSHFDAHIVDSNLSLSDPTLRIDLESIHVHTVKAIQVRSTKSQVRRTRWTKPVGKADF